MISGKYRANLLVPQYYKRAVYRPAPRNFEVANLTPTKSGSFTSLVPAALSDQFQASHIATDYEYILLSATVSLPTLGAPSQSMTYGDPGMIAFGFRICSSFATG